jgi:hypothetical protein
VQRMATIEQVCDLVRQAEATTGAVVAPALLN